MINIYNIYYIKKNLLYNKYKKEKINQKKLIL